MKKCLFEVLCTEIILIHKSPYFWEMGNIYFPVRICCHSSHHCVGGNSRALSVPGLLLVLHHPHGLGLPSSLSLGLGLHWLAGSTRLLQSSLSNSMSRFWQDTRMLVFYSLCLLMCLCLFMCLFVCLSLLMCLCLLKCLCHLMCLSLSFLLMWVNLLMCLCLLMYLYYIEIHT